MARDPHFPRRAPGRRCVSFGLWSTYYRDWLDHSSHDDYWKAIAPREHWTEITAPALNMGGWYHLFLKVTLANHVGMKQHDQGAAVGLMPDCRSLLVNLVVPNATAVQPMPPDFQARHGSLFRRYLHSTYCYTYTLGGG